MKRTSATDGMADALREALKIAQAQKADSDPIPKMLSVVPRGDNRAAMQRRGSEEDEDIFEKVYDKYGLIEPPWLPSRMYAVYEESDMLGACVRAYVNNIERNYDYEFTSADGGDKDGKEAAATLSKLKSFFTEPNEKHSWLTLRKKLRSDREITGNAYLEVLRNPQTGEPDIMYWVPATWMRATRADEAPTPCYVKMRREGKLVTRVVWRRFRRFARAFPGGKIEWFSEFGDPRIVDRRSGNYMKDDKGAFIREDGGEPGRRNVNPSEHRANEIWWFRDTFGGNTYGIPRWIGAIASVRGRYLADWINYDTLDHAGIPPWLLMVYGRLSKGTRQYLQQLVDKWRDPNAYSDPGVIEIEPNILGFNSSGGAKTGAEFISMRDMRSEEAMFSAYRRETMATIAQTFGLPPIIYGSTEGQTNATAVAAMENTEVLIFAPAKMAFDERVNNELVKGEFNIYDWEVKTKSNPIGAKEDLYRALGMAGRTGGPSMNQLLAMQNEVFGTKWEDLEGPLYDNVSSAEAMALLRMGSVKYEEDFTNPTWQEPPSKGGGEAGASGAPTGETQAAKRMPAGVDPKGDMKAASDDDPIDDLVGKIRRLQPMARTVNLWSAMEEVQRLIDAYQPPDVTDEDFVQ